MTDSRARHRGAIILLACLVLLVAIGCIVTVELASPASAAARERITQRVLAEAREALLAYAADRAIDTIVGPGYLPCPDLDNDGWAESTCGSLSGASGQQERLGRLPWKTLGLGDLRDADGERLWYAVSARHKGLLNCAASAGCVDMSPEAALGTITVRTPSGALVHDGTIAEPSRAHEGGAVAVVIAPGAPLGAQARACPGAGCNDPANYLEADNTGFTDRARDGFTQGPVVDRDGRVAMNDRVVAIGYRDLMPRIMRRVALEVASCVKAEAAASGRYPAIVPPCATGWSGAADARFGRLAEHAWTEPCNLASPPSHSWWKAWRAHVFVAVRPGALEVVDAEGRILARERDAAVIVAGPPLARDGFVQQRDAGAMDDPRQWLEATNALLESAAGCTTPPPFACEGAGTCARVTVAAPGPTFNDVALAIP